MILVCGIMEAEHRLTPVLDVTCVASLQFCWRNTLEALFAPPALKMESLTSFSLGALRAPLLGACRERVLVPGLPFCVQNEPSAAPKKKNHISLSHICSIRASDVLYNNVTVAPATQHACCKEVGNYTSDR